MSAALEIEAIRVGYPGAGGWRAVVDGLSLTLPPGAIGCLLGASGCGKTTVLRAIAGFEPLHAGRIALDREVIASVQSMLPPERRRVGLMFQDYALFPHLSVRDNIGFGLARLGRDARRSRIAEMLALVGLAGRATAFPHELSGGQQQRVALARALAPAPRLLLLDEPFSNLDHDTRQRLALELRALLKAAGTTVLMVTHDQTEAFAIADAIGVMADGRLRQWADAATLYRAPADRIVAGFVGRGRWVSGAALGLSPEVEVRLRPGDLGIADDGEGAIRAVLQSLRFEGPHFLGELRFDNGDTAEIAFAEAADARIGETLTLRPMRKDWLIFPRRSPDGERDAADVGEH